jgi:hypothetical protein
METLTITPRQQGNDFFDEMKLYYFQRDDLNAVHVMNDQIERFLPSGRILNIGQIV